MQQVHESFSAADQGVMLRDRAERSAGLVARLTPRQRAVLEAMVDGLLNKQIAIRLGINEKTVKMHRASLLDRLQVPNSASAVRIGVEASFAPAPRQAFPYLLRSLS
jgi:DNA-binding NarL/FixJ family response regulator